MHNQSYEEKIASQSNGLKMVGIKPFSNFSSCCCNATPPRRLRILQNFLHRLFRMPSKMVFNHFSKPDTRNPVFCPVVRFSKKCIFEVYLQNQILGCKNFPGQKVSGFRFLPKSSLCSIFVYWTLSSNVLGCHMLNLRNTDARIRFFVRFSGFPKTCSGLFEVGLKIREQAAVILNFFDELTQGAN